MLPFMLPWMRDAYDLVRREIKQRFDAYLPRLNEWKESELEKARKNEEHSIRCVAVSSPSWTANSTARTANSAARTATRSLLAGRSEGASARSPIW